MDGWFFRTGRAHNPRRRVTVSRVALATIALLPSLVFTAAGAPAASADHSDPGGVFVTGHDPDFHAFRGGNHEGARNIIRRAVAYVTFGHASPRMLLVTDLRDAGGGYSDPRLGVTAAGFSYDLSDFGSGASGVLDLRTVDFTTYDVIVVASDFGGWLRQDELTILNARGEELRRYINGGGGLVVLSQGGNSRLTTCCEFGFLPFLVTSTALGQGEVGYTVTAAGAAMGLTNSDINGNASHLHFTSTGGMDVINVDASRRVLSLATRGNFIGDDGIKPAMSVDDVAVTEGNSGTVTAAFTVRLSRADPQDVISVKYSTADGTAAAGPDYEGQESEAPRSRFDVDAAITRSPASVCPGPPAIASGSSSSSPTTSWRRALVTPGAQLRADALGMAGRQPVSGSLTFAVGETTKTVTVVVRGDSLFEPDERFLLNLFDAVEAGIVDSQGIGVILNDDPANAFPTARAGGPYTVLEGGSVVLDGSGSSDPDNDPLAFAWDLDGDGTFETPGATPVLSAAGRDGPSSVAVPLRVCDPSGACATDETRVATTNVAPVPDAGPDRTVFRGVALELAGTWSDPAGPSDGPYAFTWDVPGGPSSGTAPYGTTLSRSASFATEGTYAVGLAVTDKDGATGTDTATVRVLNRAPDCTAARPSLATLWPPDHRFVDVRVEGLADPEGDPLGVVVTSIRQDEAVNGKGDGNTSPDAKGVGTSSAGVRAERTGGGDGRVYQLGFSAGDGHGGACQGVVKVTVPHDQSGRLAVDGGPRHDSTTA